MSKQMVYAAAMSLYSIGARLRLENDYPNIDQIREVL